MLSESHVIICRYHMFGDSVQQLRVLLVSPSSNTSVVFQRDGNYGDNWYNGQVTLTLTTETTVSDITQKVILLILISSMFNRHYV